MRKQTDEPCLEDDVVPTDVGRDESAQRLFFDPKEVPLVSVSGNYNDVILLRLDTGESTVIETGDEGFDIIPCHLGHRSALAVGGMADVCFVDLQTRRKAKGGLVGHVDMVNAVVDVPSTVGEDLVASASEDGTVRVWKKSALKQIRHYAASHRVRAMCCVPSRKWFVAGSMDGMIGVWDFESGQAVTQPAHRVGPWQGKPVRALLSGSKSGDCYFSGSASRKIRMYSLDAHKCVCTFTGPEDCSCLLRHPTQEFQFFSGHYNGAVLLWDVRKSATPVMKRKIHRDVVHRLVHVGGYRFASVSWDQTVRVWTSGETRGPRKDGEEKTRKLRTKHERNHGLCCVVPFVQEADLKAELEERVKFLFCCVSGSVELSGVSEPSGSPVRIFRFFA